MLAYMRNASKSIANRMATGALLKERPDGLVASDVTFRS
jgi:hypothetical protein